MSINPDEDTEFNDALRKHGILPPRAQPPPSPSPPPSPTFDDLLNDFTPSELREISEDAPDDETERMIAAYRLERIAEQRQADRKARFGRVYPIGREDYTREVTDASRINDEDDEAETGTGVICFLYKGGIPRSDRAFEHVRNLASRYPRAKFVSIVGDKCIPNLPDSRVPMIIVYRKGEIRNQIIAWGADRERRPEELEAILILSGVIIPLQQSQSEKSQNGDESDDPSSQMRSATTSTNRRGPKNIRSSGKKDDDSDSDFDFDL